MGRSFNADKANRLIKADLNCQKVSKVLDGRHVSLMRISLSANAAVSGQGVRYIAHVAGTHPSVTITIHM